MLMVLTCILVNLSSWLTSWQVNTDSLMDSDTLFTELSSSVLGSSVPAKRSDMMSRVSERYFIELQMDSMIGSSKKILAKEIILSTLSSKKISHLGRQIYTVRSELIN